MYNRELNVASCLMDRHSAIHTMDKPLMKDYVRSNGRHPIKVTPGIVCNRSTSRKLDIRCLIDDLRGILLYFQLSEK